MPRISEKLYELAKEKLEDIWNLRNLDEPAIIARWPQSSRYLEKYREISRRTRNSLDTILKTSSSSLRSHQAYKACLLSALDQILIDVKALKLGFRNLPLINSPYMDARYMAMLFGCKFIDLPSNVPELKVRWPIPIIREAEDVYNLKEIDVEEDVFPLFREMIEYFKKVTRRSLPILANPPVAPFEVVRAIWDFTSWIKALYLNPEEIRYLLNMLTDLYIQFNTLFREAVGDLGVTVHPTRIRVTGALGYMSPQLLNEFVRPCYERLSRAIGPVRIQGHERLEGLSILASVEGFRGFEYTPPSMDVIADIREILKGRGVLMVNNSKREGIVLNPRPNSTPFGSYIQKHTKRGLKTIFFFGSLENWKRLMTEMRGNTGLVIELRGNSRKEVVEFGRKLENLIKSLSS